MALVKSLDYSSNKPLAAQSKPEILRFRSDNSDYSSGDTLRIEIPCGRQGQHLYPLCSYVEGSVKVNYTNTATASRIFLDGNVYSLFRRMRVLHGSNVLEDILYPNRLWNAVYDIQRSISQRHGDTINLLVSPIEEQYGRSFGATISGTHDTASFDFSFILPSAVLGCLAEKAIPLSLCGASSIYLELELESATQCFVGEDVQVTALNKFTLSNIYYNAKVSILPYDIEKAIIESTSGIINLHAVCYKGEQKTISVGATSFNDKFAFQYSSIKNFIFLLQNSTSANGTITSLGITQRPRCDLKEFYILLNGESFPSQPINSLSKMYMEVLRSFDMMTDIDSAGYLDYILYDAPNGADAAAQLANDVYASIDLKRFVGAIDFDRFNHSSQTLMSGINTVGNTVNLNLLFDTGLKTNTTVYAFVMYDLNIKLSGGLLQAYF
jgi:hypothetical protein